MQTHSASKYFFLYQLQNMLLIPRRPERLIVTCLFIQKESCARQQRLRHISAASTHGRHDGHADPSSALQYMTKQACNSKSERTQTPCRFGSQPSPQESLMRWSLVWFGSSPAVYYKTSNPFFLGVHGPGKGGVTPTQSDDVENAERNIFSHASHACAK